uniref:uncharacterized protein LOC120331865 isoform X2 n=1 Tax=Styela clava TaxID=7725 RepID=UPI0019392CD9|nr:uncharacterized protein LOC120331865 isoform X2 [Styela clava]
MDENANMVPRIMLSGFDAEAEKKYMINIIKNLKAIYLSDPANSQDYIHSCTHIVCKKPNRCEKYLAACASGKWVLTPYFLHESNVKKQWVPEKDYEWGINISPLYPKDLQTAPRRWREKIHVKHMDRPFLGWTVGLVMDSNFYHAYARIVEAGGGTFIDITSRYTSDSQSKTKKVETKQLLTHVLVTPQLASKISRSRAEDVPHLRAEYLAMYLIKNPPPRQEEYSIFHNEGAGSIKKNKTEASQKKNRTFNTQTSKSESLQTKTPIHSVKKASLSQKSSSIRPQPIDTAALEIRSEQTRPQESSNEKHSETSKKSSFAFPAYGYPSQTDSNIKLPSGNTNQKTTEVVAKSPSISNVLAKNTVILRSPGLNKPTPLLSALTANTTDKSFPNQRSLFSVFGPIQVQSSSAGQPKDSTSQDTQQPSSAVQLQSPQKSKVPTTTTHCVPTISLGTKRSGEPQSTSSKTSDAPNAKSKRFCSDDFLARNYAVFQEFSIRKKKNSFYGVFDEVSNEDDNLNELSLFQTMNSKSFSREVMTSLEASLEVNYRYTYFLKEVSSRMTRTAYPPPEVIYVIMKHILLDSEDRNLSNNAFDVLQRILRLHSPQSNDLKNEKLYHRSFALMTTTEADETSTIMATIGDMLSRSNKADWSYWTSRDPSLGVHWTFFSRVIKMAIQPATTTYGQNGVKNEKLSPQKIQNATLLTNFLTNVVIKDYHDVLTKNEYSSNSSIIKCLIADLLWPTMTGLEPWFRRPSPNLADLVTLFVKSAESHLSHLNAQMPQEDEDDDLLESDEDTEEPELPDPCEQSFIIFEHMCRLITVTESWCIHCDVRDKERGKRTGSRSFESDLVSTLRFELEERKIEVLELILQNIPPRLRIKVNVALIQEICSDVLVADTVQPDAELSLELITSRHMQMMPSVLQGEEKSSDNAEKGDEDQNDIPPSSTAVNKTEVMKDSDDNSSDPAIINKRNRKGETPLHMACMNNRPDVVKSLLKKPGIDPNLTDYAGWTALGEACNHGHMECVKALLELPLQTEIDVKDGDDSKSSLWIDVTLCPVEGQTPLHDALGNGHLDVACVLLRKGGVQLLDKADLEDRTPLDYCDCDNSRSYMIEYACKIAQETTGEYQTTKKVLESKIMKLAPKESYEKVLPRDAVLESDIWRDRIRWYFKVTCLLLSHYVSSGGYVHACMKIGPDSERELDSPTRVSKNRDEYVDDVIVTDDDDAIYQPEDMMTSRPISRIRISRKDIHRYANDVSICLQWDECWALFEKHIKRLLSDDIEIADEIFSDEINPVPTDLIPDISTGFTK